MDNRKRLDRLTEEFLSKNPLSETQYVGVDIVTGEPVATNLFDGNMSIEGVSGSGKTVGLNFMLRQVLEYDNVEVVVFDMCGPSIKEGGKIVQRHDAFSLTGSSDSLDGILSFLNEEYAKRSRSEKSGKLFVYIDEFDYVIQYANRGDELLDFLLKGPSVGIHFLCGMQTRFTMSSVLHFEYFQHVLTYDAECPTHRFAFYDAESRKAVTFPFTDKIDGNDFKKA